MNREEALDVALGQIERQFGKGSVMRMSDAAQVSVGAVSTGSLSLDLALGIGGLPRGRIVEVFGPESSGKTTLVYHVIAEAQRRGGICAFIDAEHSMDPTYARRIGVDIDQLLVSQPDTGEQALEITELLIRSGAVDIVAVDSVAALTPKAEIEGEMGDSHVGLQARLMSQALRKLAGTLNRTDTICLFTNQLREKIGVMFGSPETTPGGRALKFYSSVRLDIRRIETLKEGTEAIGNRVRVKVVKNKVAPPFKQAEFDVMYGQGISWEGTVLDVGLERKIVMKSGSYFSFGDERLGQGRQNATAFLTENPDLVQSILARIQAEAGPEQIVSARLLPTSDDGGDSRGDAGRRRGGSRGLTGHAAVATITALRAARGRRRGRARRRTMADAARRRCAWRPVSRSGSSSIGTGCTGAGPGAASSPCRAGRRACARSTRALAGVARRATRPRSACPMRTGETSSSAPSVPASWTTRGSRRRGRDSSRNEAPGTCSCWTTSRVRAFDEETARAAVGRARAGSRARCTHRRGPRRERAGRCATSRPAGSRRRRSSPHCGSRKRSARMSGLHPDFPCKRVVPNPLKP